MQDVKLNKKCFTVLENELEGRIDPHFYKPEFKRLSLELSKLKNEKLDNIINFSSEIWNQKDFFDNEFPYIEISQISTITGNINGVAYCNKKEAPSRARMIVREGDIIVSTTRPNRGAIAIIDKEKDGFIASTGFAILRDLKKNINKEYLFYYLRTSLSLNQMLRRSSGGNYPAITSEELKQIVIPVPSIEIQNKVVSLMHSTHKQKEKKEKEAEEILSSIDDYVLKELVIKINELKNKTCFAVNAEEAYGKRLDPKGYSEIPKAILKAVKKSKYKAEALSALISKSIAGEWGEELEKVKNQNEYILAKVLRNTNFENKNNLSFDDVAERLIEKNKFEKVRLLKGDLLIEKSGGSPIQPVGRIALFEKSDKDFCFSNFLQCLRVNKEKILPEYLFVFLKALYSLNYMEYVQNQTTGIKNLIMEEYLAMPVPLPTIDIQKSIAKGYQKKAEQAEKLKQEAKSIVEKAKEEVEKIILNQ